MAIDTNYPDLDEMEQAHLDAHCEALESEREEQEAKDEGYCIHCGADIDKCTGYKCWIRQHRGVYPLAA